MNTTDNTAATADELVTRLDHEYGHSPHYLIGRIEYLAGADAAGTPRQRLARISRAIAAWDTARNKHEHDGS